MLQHNQQEPTQPTMHPWIKINHNLPDHPKVAMISLSLNLNPEEVIGKLINVWITFAKFAKDGDPVWRVDRVYMEMRFGSDFIGAMVQVNWLQFAEDGVILPGIDQWQITTDTIAVKSEKRIAQARAAANARWNAPDAPAMLTAHAKKRKEKKRKEEEGETPSTPPPPPLQSNPQRKAPSDLKRTMESIEEEFGPERTFKTYEAMKKWCASKGETPSLRRLVTWLRRDDADAERFAHAAPAPLPPDPLGLRSANFDPKNCL